MFACLEQIAIAQVISGKGFLPDENGTNLDDPQASKAAQRQKVAPGTIIKDCADCPEMVVLPSGSFLMGSNNDRRTTPEHLVSIKTFLIGQTEVTQKLWKAVMGNNPSYYRSWPSPCSENCPVEQVSWDDVQQFIRLFNEKTGKRYRLPSEAEWEYAARAGTTSIWSFGNDRAERDNYEFSGTRGNPTGPVASKKANPFGLFDVYGNVSEWVQDCWHDSYIGAPTDGSSWITSCDFHSSLYSNVGRIRRGYTSTERSVMSPYSKVNYLGFRLARDL